MQHGLLTASLSLAPGPTHYACAEYFAKSLDKTASAVRIARVRRLEAEIYAAAQ
jgi:hypothetical protein